MNNPSQSHYGQSILPAIKESQDNSLKVGRILAPYIPLSQLIDMGFEMLDGRTPDIHW